jgi:hypothetical protein
MPRRWRRCAASKRFKPRSSQHFVTHVSDEVSASHPLPRTLQAISHPTPTFLTLLSADTSPRYRAMHSRYFTFCGHVVYPAYAFSTQLLNNSVLRAREIAGARMWVWVLFAYLIPAIVITMQILSPAHAPRQRLARAAWPRPAVRSLNDGEVEEL